MAIKKVPSDASIRIGSIWFPVRNLPAALARHTKLVFCLTGSDDHPYSLRGSATGLKFQDRHLLFYCGHQIANIEPRNVVIPLDKEGRTLISGQQMVSLDHVQELLGEEILDLTAMRFDPAKYGPSPVDLGFFDIRGSDVWIGDPQTTLLVFGYPTSLRSVEIDDVSGALSGLKVKMIATAASYIQASQASGLHAIRLLRSGDYTSDGLSGGTVYHVGEDAHGFYCGFAGLVIRGSETSDILHFIDSRAIYPFFRHQEWLAEQDSRATAPLNAQTSDPEPGSDVEFILTNTDRLITVTIRCVISFGAADGLNDFLLADKKDQHHEWRETVWCFQRDGLLMAALRAAILLDPHERVLSFAGINRRLGRPEVRAALLQALEDRHGPDDIPPSRAELIDEFHETFKEIDQDAYKRLRQFRNRGIAHLTPEKMLKSVTLGELRALIAIISRLATTLQHLCQVQSAFRSDMLDEYRELAKRTIKP